MSSAEAPRDSESIHRGKHMDCTGLFNNAASKEGKITAGRKRTAPSSALKSQKWMAKPCPPHDPVGKMSRAAKLFSQIPSSTEELLMETSMGCRTRALQAQPEGSFNPGVAVACWNLQENRAPLKVFWFCAADQRQCDSLPRECSLENIFLHHREAFCLEVWISNCALRISRCGKKGRKGREIQ